MKYYIKLMRPKHYVKNLLILLPLVFSGNLLKPEFIPEIIWGFIVFCLLSSSIYIINDICDADKDRLHPEKCKRPIASGKVPVHSAIILDAVIFAAIIVLCIFAKCSPVALIYLALYLVLNISYNCGLKDIPIIDVTILVSGFLLRLLFGSAITGISISNWLYLTVITLSFYMGLGKRRNELRNQSSDDTRKVLRHYPYEFLDKSMYMSLTLAIVFYAMWTVSGSSGFVPTSELIWTVPMVIIICLKYNLTIEGTSDGDPVEVIFHDKILIALIILFIAILIAMLYGIF